MRPRLFGAAALVGLLGVLGRPVLAEAQGGIRGGDTSGTNGNGQSSESVATEGAEFLLLPTGARSAGMGGAVTALRGNYEAVLYSPAGLADLSKRRMLFTHSESAFETSSQLLALFWPTESLGTFGVSYYLVDFGELPSTSVDGTVQGTVGYRNQEFLLSFARSIIGSVEAGVSYKLVQLVYQCNGRCTEPSFTRSTHAVDFGLIYDQPIGLPITVGGAVRHLGLPIEGAAEKDPLPTRVRVGVNFADALNRLTRGGPFALALAVDIEDQWRELGEPDVLLGSELAYAEFFFLRAGYAFQDTGRGGPALGIGVTRDWFYLDLSRGFDDVAAATGEESVQVSFGVVF